MVEPLECELPPPSLNDNTGDLDRLMRALKQQGFSPVQVHPSRINHLVRQIRQGRFKVTAVLGYHRCHWELMEVFAGFEKPSAPGICD